MNILSSYNLNSESTKYWNQVEIREIQTTDTVA